MEFGLSTKQDILKRAARKFLAAECPVKLVRGMVDDERGFPPDLWRKMADLGWMGLPFPEQYGGRGGNLVDLAVVLEEMGRVNLPDLFFTAVVLGGMVIKEAGTERQKEALLPSIAKGDCVVTLAVLEDSLSYDPMAMRATARATGSGYVIDGTKLFVPDAHLADYVVCAARNEAQGANSEDVSLMLVKMANGQAPGIGVTKLPTMAGDKKFAMTFEDARVSADEVLGKAGEAKGSLERVLDVAVMAKCAEMVGGAQKVIDLAVDHAHNRIQFGRPIGSFQAIQHHCANMLLDVDLGRFLTYQAAWLLSEGKPSRKEVSASKAFMGDAYMRVIRLGHQVLGGVGLIEEHEMPLFTKRGPSAHQAFGSPDYHRELVVRELGL